MFAATLAPHLVTDSARGGSDYYAGAVFGWIEEDIKANMDACFPADDDLQAALGDMMDAIKAGKIEEIAQLDKKTRELFEADLKEGCSGDETIKAAWDKIADIYAEFTAQEDYEKIMQQNYLDNKVAIDGYLKQMVEAWDIKKYYESGKLGGLGSAILFAM